MRILVVGRNGQVARALARLGASEQIESIGRPDLDLERPQEITAVISSRRPDIVINAAAFTAVDKAEAERERTFLVNASAAGALSQAAADIGAPIIHLSTDYVFSGQKADAYVESDATGPRSVYGASKLDGERLVHATNPRAVILRTSWVFDAQGANFVRTMLRLARSRDTISVVADQNGCPTFARDLAAAILAIATRAPEITHYGVYHCAGAGQTTWADFAEAIFAESKLRGGPEARVVRITTSEYPTPASRPANSVLNCAKLASDYGIVMPPWRESLAKCLDEIAAGGWSAE